VTARILISTVVVAALLAGTSVARGFEGAAESKASLPSFAPAKSYETGRAPWSVAIGDLNGDGKPDLATGNVRANTVSVLLNRGHGRFAAKRDYRSGSFPHTAAIGDLNGDGKRDLAVANFGAGTVSVLLNAGRTLRPKRDYTAGDGANSVAIGDLNGDGSPDLVTPNVWAGTVSVLLNKGDGSFRAGRDYATGDETSSVAIGDLNGDGKLDLATANEQSTVVVLLNEGDGSFRTKVEYRTGDGVLAVAIGDMNGDRKPDLATANAYERSVSVLLNAGDGSFGAGRDYRTGRAPSSVAIGDLNGDGHRDLATGNAGCRCAGAVSLLLNRGDGSFRAALDYAPGLNPQWIVIGDLNGDGKSDLATANSPSTVSVLLNSSGLCTVPDVRHVALVVARRAVARARCRLGTVHRVYSLRVKRGRVISQSPKPGTVLPRRGKVTLVISRGRQPS
jgi:FG-GAP-like repeat/PASTA domain/FG-GAP repeat